MSAGFQVEVGGSCRGCRLPGRSWPAGSALPSLLVVAQGVERAGVIEVGVLEVDFNPGVAGDEVAGVNVTSARL